MSRLHMDRLVGLVFAGRAEVLDLAGVADRAEATRACRWTSRHSGRRRTAPSHKGRGRRWQLRQGEVLVARAPLLVALLGLVVVVVLLAAAPAAARARHRRPGRLGRGWATRRARSGRRRRRRRGGRSGAWEGVPELPPTGRRARSACDKAICAAPQRERRWRMAARKPLVTTNHAPHHQSPARQPPRLLRRRRPRDPRSSSGRSTKYGAPVYVRHEIVHNRHVVERPARPRARCSSTTWTRCRDDAPVVFSAHGVPKSVPAEARRAQPALSRRHLPAGLQGARRGRAALRRRAARSC